MDFREMLVKALGLAADCSDDDISAALSKTVELAKAEPVAVKQVFEALGIDSGSDVSAVVASINVLKQEKKSMVSREEFAALQDKLARKEAGDLVAAAMKAGKITPEQKEWADEYAKRDAKGFELFVAKAPVVIHVSKLPKKEGDVLTTESQEVLQVAKMFGNSADDLKKYGH